MNPQYFRSPPPQRTRPAIAIAFLAAGVLFPRWTIAAEVPQPVAYCMECHGNEGFSMTLGDGSTMDLYENSAEFAASVHGKQLVCTDCHERYDEGHPSGTTVASRREYHVASYEICKKCHFGTYTRTLESVHYELLKRGTPGVPVCTDCHGAHAIQDPHAKRAMMSRSCAACHVDIYGKYSKSVHGKALVEEGIETVPACVDCHTAHRVVDPRNNKFRLASPDTCINCHGNEELMAQFGIPTSVATTYLSDFHGVTASLAKSSEVENRQLVVACIDCHGVHEIQSPKLIGAKEMTDRVRAVCSSCHKGASTEFPAAWLSHYQPSLQHAPLVFIVGLVYRVFIPFVVGGLALQVLLHLYRVAVRR